MTRILYGVCGEGMGHALRSKAIIDHLKKKHHVTIIASQRAYEFLKKQYYDVHDIYGLHIKYRDNEVKNIATVVENTAELPLGTMKTLRRLTHIMRRFNPDVCVTDFEPYTYYLARIARIPCIAIDNINMITRTNIRFDNKFRKEYLLAKAAVNIVAPNADHYFLTTFFFPKTKYKNTLLFPPIIRKEVMDAKDKVKEKNHMLVYQTSRSNHRLFDTLKHTDHNYIIYGFDKSKKDKNLEYKKFSLKGFVKDLAESKGIITNGGYSLISEAIYLGKPILSEPVKKQFEQIMNATYVKREGYGLFTEKVTKEDIKKFTDNLEKYKKNVSRFQHDDNQKLFNKLDRTISRYSQK